MFKQLTALVPEVDLFASRLNCQLTPFVSWKPEPGAWAVNAFSLCWTALKFYAFPPCSILGKVLAKVQQDGATGKWMTLFWSTQLWFPQLLELLIDHPRMLQPRKDLLQLNGRLEWCLHFIQSWLSWRWLYQDSPPRFGLINNGYNPHL